MEFVFPFFFFPREVIFLSFKELVFHKIGPTKHEKVRYFSWKMFFRHTKHSVKYIQSPGIKANFKKEQIVKMV